MDDKDTEEAHVLTHTMTKVGGWGGGHAQHTGRCVCWGGLRGPVLYKVHVRQAFFFSVGLHQAK